MPAKKSQVKSELGGNVPALLALLITLMVVFLGITFKGRNLPPPVLSFSDCVTAAGAVVTYTNPRWCYLPDGRRWQEAPKVASLTWDECIKLKGAKVTTVAPQKCVAPDGRIVTKGK